MKNKSKKETPMKHFFNHLRKCIFRGLLAIIPLLLCFFALQLLYVLIDKKIMAFLDNFFQIHQIPGLGIFLLLVCLYLIGLIVGNFVGKQALRVVDDVGQRIPLLKTIYGVGKQLSQSLSSVDSEKRAFKKAILVKLDNSGIMVPAFLMNTISNRKTKEEYYVVLAPTAPTPGSGFVLVVPASQTVDPGWSVEECLKAVVSVGIVLPKDIENK